MPLLQEGELTFDFPDEGSDAAKYDEWSFFRNQFQTFCGGAKGVDFIFVEHQRTWLIEVKDYRHHRRTKIVDLSHEVAAKIRDTLAGLAACRCNANDTNKLPLYEAWDFPELWVVVPPGAKRKRRRPEGVTIHRLQGGRYRSLPASMAFPGWTAEEIHAGLTDRVPSARTDRVLERVGRTLGAREGTGPDDTPLLRSLGERARADARAEELAASARSVLQARGIQVSNPDSVTAAALAGVPRDALLAAAVSAVDEADFRRRLAAVWRRRMAARNEP